MNVYEMAQKYYPRLWSAERLKTLVEAAKLTAEQYTEITRLVYAI